MSHIKRISTEHLEIGMYITTETKGVADGKMQNEGFIQRQDTLDKLREKNLKEFFIDVSKGKDSRFAHPILSNNVSFKPRLTLKVEREKAERVYGEARGMVEDLLNDVKMGKAIDVAPVNELADDINNSILNNPNALQCLSQIREKDRYLLEHSVNVGILMSIFSTYLGFDKNTVKELTTGGLLHDIGKIRVPSEILNKAGKLTDDEWVEMKRHVVYGQEVLIKSEGISDIAKSICGLHHERLDGTGYPMGIDESKIDVYGRMAAIVDVYDAVTASRCYHEGMAPFKAMKLLVSMTESHLDKTLVYSFIRCMSVYPVGTVIELSNGKLGVVIEPNLELSNKPIVRIFYNMKSRHYEQCRILNLATSKLDIEIVKTWHPDELDICIHNFL
ncbi:HD-GYP domain-containing protein [Agarilytica rhodophyticola]|uniref:HD-GYP domain-containing protein n=1 Tax=Agarilytica rhodophyticola TaxID=1737490 RepID=UPI000B348AFE|nr:HD-GYP domain-containing protein [Agarilytica rhodophyticola]